MHFFHKMQKFQIQNKTLNRVQIERHWNDIVENNIVLLIETSGKKKLIESYDLKP